MFSGSTLLIILGFSFICFICIIFPLAPTTRFAVIVFFSYTIYFVIGWFYPLSLTSAILLTVSFLPFFIVDALLLNNKSRVIRSMPKQLARGVPSNFTIDVEIDGTQQIHMGKTQIRQPRCADIVLSNQEGANNLTGEITAYRRGRHLLPPFSTRIQGPLGLAILHQPYNEVHELHVFPDLPSAYRLARSIQQGRFSTAGLKRRGPLGLGTNFDSVREYFPDDDIRNINWAATARTRNPMTNQYRVEQDRDVIMLIDTGRLMGAPLPIIQTENIDLKPNKEESLDPDIFVTRLDLALDAVCGVTSVADVMGDRSGVVVFNSTVTKYLKPRRRGSRAVVRTIYDLESIPTDSDYEAACQKIGKSKRSFVIIFTDFLDQQSIRPLVRALGSIVRKHRVVVAGIIDDDVEQILNHQVNDKYLYIGASEMHESALRAIELVKNTGAEVVYCQQKEFMVECVKTYLAAKQRAAF